MGERLERDAGRKGEEEYAVISALLLNIILCIYFIQTKVVFELGCLVYGLIVVYVVCICCVHI